MSSTPNRHNGYFFVYIAADSTQNLGNLNATYKGAELSLTARPTDRLDLYAGYGYTDSRITAMADPTVIGNQAPLVSRDTINAGAQYRQPLADGPQRHGAPGLPGDRPHLVGSVQHDLPRSGLAGGPAPRAAGGEVDGHRLVEEPDQQDLQRRVLPGQLGGAGSCGGPRRAATASISTIKF